MQNRHTVMENVVGGLFSGWIGRGKVKCRVRRHRGTIFNVEWMTGCGPIQRALIDVSDPKIQQLLLTVFNQIPRSWKYLIADLPSSSRLPATPPKRRFNRVTYKKDVDSSNVPQIVEESEIEVGCQIECSASGSRQIPLSSSPNVTVTHPLGADNGTSQKCKQRRPRDFAGVIGEKKVYTCQECFMEFSRSFNLRRHMDSKHTAQVMYTCPFCDREYKHPRHFEEHRRSHLMQRSFECELCDQKYPSRNALIAHSKKHKRLEEKSGEVSEPKRHRQSLTYRSDDANGNIISDSKSKLRIPFDFAVKI